MSEVQEPVLGPGSEESADSGARGQKKMTSLPDESRGSHWELPQSRGEVGDYSYLGDFPPPRVGDGPRLTAVSLFSGAMGLDLGFELAGYDIKFASDNFPAAVDTIRANRPQLPVHAEDIRSLSGEEILSSAGIRKSELDIVIGGPPCQSFSTAGLRRGLDDSGRGPLLFDFTRLLGELRPRAFVMENVKGLLSSPRH